MINSLSEKYKVEKSNIEKSYEYHVGLKNNEEYERMVDDAFLEFAKLFKELYPKAQIDTPKEREKSKQSLKNKIEKLEIERLCKLYAIDEISKEEKQSLHELILNKINIAKRDVANTIISEQLKTLDDVDIIIQDKEISEHIKTALLRIVNTNLQKENNKELQKQLDKKYGELAAKDTGELKNNLLRWDKIEKINDKEILHYPFECLKSKDLRGIRFVIVGVPDDIQTDNVKLKELIKRRRESLENEKTKYSDLCCVELSKDFVNKIISDEELLKRLNIEVLPEGYTHKEKQNGYIAEHVKFCIRGFPEYSFELQVRSMNCENEARANGSAAHDKRSGKKRVLPSLANKNLFIERLKNILPKYKILKFENNNYKLHKCTLAENMLEYFLGYMKLDSSENEKLMQYVQEEQNKIRRIKRLICFFMKALLLHEAYFHHYFL